MDDEPRPAGGNNPAMNFSFTDDQLMIRDAAENFLADASDSAAVRRAGEQGCDASVWARIGAELGWCGVPVAEAHGGLGLGPVEMVLLFEQMGRRLLCSPYFSTVGLAATLLQEAGTATAQAEWLPRIAEGAARISVPLPARDWHQSAQSLSADFGATGWTLTGQVSQVVDDPAADAVLIPAPLAAGGIGWFMVRAVAARSIAGWDGTRRLAQLDLQQVAATRVDDPARCAEGTQRALALARLYLAAEALGGAQQCLDLTVAYTAGRKQFGRVIASFQAVKHRAAEMMVRIEGLRSALYGAAAVAAAAPDTTTLTMECAMARALSIDAYFACAQEAIQLHGGVGFTWEYDPQLYFKRAQAASHMLGSASHLRAELAEQLFARPDPAHPTHVNV